jgi:hypothetical protein
MKLFPSKSKAVTVSPFIYYASIKGFISFYVLISKTLIIPKELPINKKFLKT